MKKNKVTYIKEQKLKNKAKKDFDNILNGYSQNPIQSKFYVYKQAKEKFSPKDFLE